MENAPKLVLITTDELDSLIQSSVRKALAEHTPKSSSYSDDFPINIDEAAAFVKKPKSTIYQLTSTRQIPFNKVGKQLLFFKKDLLAWIEESKKKTQKQIEAEGFNLRGGVRK
jgi:excisionase family DNA binding protein